MARVLIPAREKSFSGVIPPGSEQPGHVKKLDLRQQVWLQAKQTAVGKARPRRSGQGAGPGGGWGDCDLHLSQPHIQSDARIKFREPWGKDALGSPPKE